jgi:Domain of unknown function (DUF1905)/Bacteriocin-protection, YdeI or OmpD-Associated
MVKFKTVILKFDKQGEKTGWTYIVIPADVALAVKPDNKKSFYVKGKLDNYSFTRTALLPMGEGEFIMPLNGVLRKAIGKRQGAMLSVMMEEDGSDFIFNPDMISCLKDEPAANNFFKKLPGSHQRYFSKWVDNAKTEATKTKRIVLMLSALSRGKGYAEMLRESTIKRKA